MEFLKALNENWAVITFVGGLIWSLRGLHSDIKQHELQIMKLEELHEKNAKTIDQVIAIQKDIEYIAKTLQELKQEIRQKTNIV